MSSADAPPRPGTVLMGKYRVERALGSGGMGVVVEATHLDLDSRVAIKLLGKKLAGEPGVVARFLREARAAAKLGSPHITRVIDIGKTDEGVPYQVMELLDGRDLASEIASYGRLDVIYAVRLVLEACEGIAMAHAAGLVHRDLKPANLFLAKQPNRPPIVKVLDFGLSKDAADMGSAALTATGEVFGTPQYMSPEQVQSTKHVDPRTDQHALAEILFEMLTGVVPYQGANVTQLLVVIAAHPVPRARNHRADIPQGLDDAIWRAMAKLPDQRFADLADFADAIAPFGGPDAGVQAERIRGALFPEQTTRLKRDGELPRIAPQSDELTTQKMMPRPPRNAPGGAVAASYTDLTSSVDPIRRSRRRRRRAFAVFAFALAVCAAFAARKFVREASQLPSADFAPAVEPVGESPSRASATATSPAPAGSADAGVDPARPTGKTPVRPRTGGVAPAPAPAPSPSASIDKAIGVFGKDPK